MLLALDARNRAISVGFLDSSGPLSPGRGRWLSRRRLGVSPGRSADEYALLLAELAREASGFARGIPAGVDAAWMSCVAPSLGRILDRAVATAFGLSCSVVGPGVRTGVRIRTEIPSEVGSDLVCASAAARELVGGPCIVVDFDAAIAFSAVGSKGDFLGVAIAPGMGISSEALRSSAALLPDVAFANFAPGGAPGPAIGRNSAQSVKAGFSIGFSGLVASIVDRQREELVALGEADSADKIAVLGTGEEEGRELLASLGLGVFVPELVLEGLAVIAARASPAARALT